VLIAMLLLSLMLKHFVASFSVFNFLVYSAIIYIAMGGIGFFISVATRFDWLTLAAVWLGSHMLRSLYGAKPGFVGKLVQLLPPVHKLDGVANGIITYRSAPASDITWLLAYGMLFFVLGLVLLKKGQLAD
jgi:ABC-type polysaccharide/polyol phosphate export permease